MLKLFARLVVVVILLGLLFGGIFYWKQEQQRMAAQMSGPQPPASVAVTEVRTDAWQPRLRAVGTVSATEGIFVTNEVSGMVREILFASGQAVRTGELLVRLEDSVDKAELRGLQAERDLSNIKFNRLAKLVKERSVSQSDYDEAKAELDSAEASVASKRALIAKKAIRAPFDGILGIRSVDIGEYLAPGAQLVPLQALDPVFVDFSLPERHFGKLYVDQPVEVRVTAHPGEVFEGQITAMNPGIEEATRSVRVQATMENPERLLRPGMFAEVDVLLPQREEVITLPPAAITYTPYGDSVFLAEEQDGQLQAQRRQVTTGAVQAGRVEILSGLAPGDRVVLAGQVKLRNGQAVQIDNTVIPSGGELGP
jgi:membrane fusion protein (multidrug efflux system)